MHSDTQSIKKLKIAGDTKKEIFPEITRKMRIEDHPGYFTLHTYFVSAALS
jgi:hypothetical protein